MHVLWMTARSMSDLCATTQRALVEGLLGRGHSMTFVNGDVTSPMEHENLTHVSLPVNARRGFQSRALGTAMKGWLATRRFEEQSTVAIVEWRIVKQVVPTLEGMGIPWTLMDRSPPADAGLFGRLQWRSWRAAWRAAKRSNARGFVVSTAHQTFVNRKIGHERSTVVPAGVDLTLFIPQAKRSTFTMVYQGRLDRHRGVLACVMLAQKVRLEGIEVNLLLIGEGDLLPSLTDLADRHAFLEVRASMEQTALAELLGTCHLGLLPMPRRGVWTLASPLKRSEYLASDLCIFGIAHEGHALEGVDEAWFSLVPQEDFHIDGVEFLRRCISDWRTVQGAPRAFAEARLDWASSVSALETGLNAEVQKDS